MGGPDRIRLGELDALRGLAALSVVFFHYTVRYQELYPLAPAMPFQVRWGSYGVDFFFAISGFVILMTLERCKRPVDFLVSRFSRLYPAYWAAVIITFLVVAVWSLPGRQVTPGQALCNLTMLQEMAGVPHVDGVYWSLQVELLFYAWMFGLFFLKRLGFIRPVVICWMLLSLVVAVASHLFEREPPYLFSKLLLLPYIGMFSVGIVAYRAMGSTGPGRTDVLTWLLAVGVAGAWGGLPGAAACLLTIMVFWLFVARRLAWLAWGPLAFLGGLSYTLYLLHQNIGYVVIRESIGLGAGPATALCVALATSLVLAALLTFGIERPAMRAIRRGGRPGVGATAT
jgi:peptidoglycan/LPS O-acetylase OafA/YrhL